MADIFTKEKRSWVMGRIRSKDTKAEKKVEAILLSKNVRFKKHYKIIGSPDFALPRRKIAIFVDGDFWHGYDYKQRRKKLPDYWKEKIRRNIERDKRTNSELKKLGWKVIRIWEHELSNADKALKRLLP